MYMPGRLRTASSPSRTVMSLARQEEPLPLLFRSVLVPVRLAAPSALEERFLLAPPRWEVFATQLPFVKSGMPTTFVTRLGKSLRTEGRGVTQVHISLPAERPGNRAEGR